MPASGDFEKAYFAEKLPLKTLFSAFTGHMMCTKGHTTGCGICKTEEEAFYML